MSTLASGEEWSLPLDASSGLSLLVLAYPGYFDFHVLAGDETLVASIFGYSQQVSVVLDPERGPRLDVGAAVVALPSAEAARALASRVGVEVIDGA